MLNKEFDFYKKNQEELLKVFNGRYIVIVDSNVVGDYGNEQEAYFESVDKFGLGNFFIILCQPGSESYTQTFHSRVVFA